MKKLHGITIAMVTPMDAQEQVDYAALTELTEFLIERGVDCLYPCGTTGEMFHLSVEERMEIARHVVAQAAGRVTVFVHVGAMTQADTLALALHAHKIGADGVGIVTPAFFTANRRELIRYYISLAHALPQDFPVYLYNIPQCAANDLTVDVAKAIAQECPNVVGIKYSFPDMLRTQEYLQVREGFSVLQGADRLLLACLAMGCDGTITGAGCAYPEVFVALQAACRSGDFERARRLQRLANGLVEAMQCGSNMAYFKTALAWRGIPCGGMRKPQLPLTDTETEAFKATLSQAEALLPEGLLREWRGSYGR